MPRKSRISTKSTKTASIDLKSLKNFLLGSNEKLKQTLLNKLEGVKLDLRDQIDSKSSALGNRMDKLEEKIEKTEANLKRDINDLNESIIQKFIEIHGKTHKGLDENLDGHEGRLKKLETTLN
ncbi:MAG: hypothetical protein HY401_01870 [Elusimicrobia bacterium]|nr:hypothetical protein [Elusimicrobiota bacterium]